MRFGTAWKGLFSWCNRFTPVGQMLNSKPSGTLGTIFDENIDPSKRFLVSTTVRRLLTFQSVARELRVKRPGAINQCDESRRS